MANYYYSENPDVESKQRVWEFELLGNNFKFTTDNGVFSKSTVDFGSRVLIDAVQSEYDLTTVKMLDVGCGYGPIGLSFAKKNPQASITMVDVNEIAMDLARTNAQNNQIENVEIFSSNQYQNITATDYDFVITNPPIRAGKDVVHGILSGAKDHLKIGGKLIAVIQKKQGAPSAEKKMNEVFGNCKIIAKKKGYFILSSVKES